MANGFGSLERFFAKKKTPASSTESVEPASNPPTIPQFPSPSFIRPKTSRMAAREEVRKQPGNRVPSLPSPLSPHRVDLMHAQSPTRFSNSHKLQYSPLKASFMSTQDDSFLDDFDVYQFPRPPTRQGETSASSSTCDPKSSMEAPSERSLPLRPSRKPATRTSRLDTPPSSDLEDEGTRSPQYFRDKKLPALPPQKPPTPESSPELRPVHIAQLRASKSIDFLNKAVCRDIRRHFTKTLDQRPLRKAISQTSLEDTTNRLSITSSTLREPDFNEFFNLSDDDIAESAPADADAVETSTYATAPSAPDSPRSSLLTLTPPYASKPATAAAFEAARIAKRYNFDLVYVVNLWTDYERLNSESPASMNSLSKKFGPLSGRLLAAYGLENVNLPFQISTTAHSKILKTPGWIEYRAKEVRNDEFARGYACAFYTGECSRGGSVISRNSSSSTCSVQSMNTDRGIIFAAYRKPRADGSLLGISSGPADLVNVHKDAEALVEMLVDIHVTNRLREPQSRCHQSEETGPMPSQRVGRL
ncbi:hypothetical protein BFJ63_vAg3825 [Fusarium oxysporum f. sp. narcissi]|uniref:Uncharacterized protein n=4 Tax=Fusarium oxysporum TaxID=5507 RepID=A0A420TUP6_FUSOX|nr:uncharacterized protein FOBCDRAFT_284016 [Fusarium oxysporum Fo47]KAF5264601.1 hypothetical protein FOXYS1_4609 [Fusarium oxysporum]RKK28931.1 hypothetical protein BFJ65_g872 [Fusarium oxysporum f. sp. cepae]RYC93517.1 hypothetical protein BFJ63_vAg3825 [Fusarium oxysporum f. sp. narcissi]EWZ50476.1 hypothetical protein FOZG_00977 [Fusarium oxysporum Fo47]QKD47667.1 hypothetical protein FOBCDRAFT_284016 [Fusarium oxysporum Fo47]